MQILQQEINLLKVIYYTPQLSMTTSEHLTKLFVSWDCGRHKTVVEHWRKIVSFDSEKATAASDFLK